MGTTIESRISSTQAKDAIYKAHSISSSASEIDAKPFVVDTVEELSGIDSTKFITAMVRDLNRGGTFIYDADKVANSNNGTNFTGWIRILDGKVLVDWFISNKNEDNGVNIQAAHDVALQYKTSLVFSGVALKSSIPLVFSVKNIEFNGTELEYIGVAKKFALTFKGDSTQDGRYKKLEGLKLINRNNEALIKKTFTVSITLPVVPSSGVIFAIGGSTAGSVEVPISEAMIGDMIIFTNYTLSSDKITLVGQCLSDGIVTIYVNNYSQTNIYAGEVVSVDITLIQNPRHGICIGGSLVKAENIRVLGFTGLSVGIGSGIAPTSGIQLSASDRLYYSEIDIQISGGWGYGIEVPGRNNINTFKITSYGYDFFNTGVSTNPNYIHEIIAGGLSNTWRRTSIEGTSSLAPLIISHWANNNYFENIYYECVNPYINTVQLTSTASANTGTIRGAKRIVDKGVVNNIIALGGNYTNAGREVKPASAHSTLYNGDFEHQLQGWSQWGTATFDGITKGFIGKAARYLLNSSSLNLAQPISGLGGGRRVSLGCWVKTNIPGIYLALSGSKMGNYTTGEGKWEFISWEGSAESGSVEIRTTGLSTGYCEISLVTVCHGSNPISIPQRTSPIQAYPITIASIPGNGVYTVSVSGEFNTKSQYLAHIDEKTWGAIIIPRYESPTELFIDFLNPTSVAITYIGACIMYVTELKNDRYDIR